MLPLLLKCAVCGHVVERILRNPRVTTAGIFVPLQCVECLAFASEPTTRPWDLTLNDRRFLRQMRIAAT